MSQETSGSEMDARKTVPYDTVPVLVPAQVWEKLLKPPFRKRHPLIFWCLVIAALLLAVMFLASIFMKDEEIGAEDSLALVSIQGAILDPAQTLAWLRRIDRSPHIKGVLVRIDSPGGGAAASQEIYDALARISKKVPVVASMGSMAASGGLMVAMAARKIYANPSTVTGSIGVRMDIPQLQDLMAKIGIGQETLVTAPFKDAASYTHPLSPQAREYLDSVLMDMHDQFVAIVAKGRNMSVEQAGKLATGKIFTGQQAKELGLVDEMGGQYEAHAWLCEQTGIGQDKQLAKMASPKKGYLKWLFTTLASLTGEAENIGAILERAGQPAFLFQL